MAASDLMDFEASFRMVTNALRRVGLWPSTKHFFSLSLYTLSTILMLISVNLHYFFQVVNWYFLKDLEAISASALIVIAEILTNVKVFCLVKYQHSIEKLIRNSNRTLFQPRNETQRKNAKFTFDLFKYFFIAFSLGANIITVLWSIYPLFEKNVDKHLPFLAWYPCDTGNMQNFVLTYIHQVTSIILMGQTHINVDCLSLGLMAMVIVECNILADSLKNIKANLGRKSKNMEITEKEWNDYLRDCVAHHREIIEYFETISSMLSICVFGQYIISTVTLCLTMLQMTFINPTDTKFLVLVSYELGMMGQLFIYCWWGNEVIDKSEQLPYAAFGGDWIEAPKKFKHNLLFFICRTQKPLTVFAMHYFKVSLASFMLILRLSYSFYALLRQVNDNGI